MGRSGEAFYILSVTLDKKLFGGASLVIMAQDRRGKPYEFCARGGWANTIAGFISPGRWYSISFDNGHVITEVIPVD